jgi:trans-2,3-dihydro-3-hydroxyanthranilate isomerase
MENLSYVTADVFTTTPYAGNPLAVVLDGQGLSTAQMQTIAREFNYSETTFVLPAENPAHAARVRIFTPTTELAFAGHPTVGTAWALAHLGHVKPAGAEARIVLEENVGPVPVTVQFNGRQPAHVTFTTAMVPRVLPAPPPIDVLAATVGLSPAEVLGTGHGPPLALTCGTPYTCVPLRDPAAVARARLDPELWRKHLSASEAHKVYVFARGTAGTLHARMFAPGEGVAEDPATGSAACAVTGWLVGDEKLQGGTGRWAIHQGREMGRPSTILVEADVRDGAIVAVRCGGTAVMMATGTIRRP